MASQSIPQLYSSLHAVVMQQIPDSCESRVTNLIWLMMGIYLSGRVHLSFIARKLPIRAQNLSLVKRLQRFLDNGAVRVREWYAPTARALLVAAASGGKVQIIIDSSKVSGNYRMVTVSLAYRRRSLPLAWVWVRGTRGHCTTKLQLKLLGYVRTLLPYQAQVSLVGDCEFGNPLLLEYLDGWHWSYALRQAGDNLIMPKGTGQWQRLDSIPLTLGELKWLGQVVLTRASAYPTQIVLYWKRGEKQPWFLATTCLCPQAALALYRRRMWIEEMFGDLKKHGFDLEASHLRHFLRLSRLTLAVCLLYVWLVALGGWLHAHHLTALVDRADRRDLSFFRLGFDFLARLLALNDPIPRVFIPNFCSVSGG